MNQVFTGALAMGFGIAGLFFIRFWRDTRERLFVFFALAFFILGASRVWFAFIAARDVHGDFLYWVRLLAFAMILLAILDKNMFRKETGE